MQKYVFLLLLIVLIGCKNRSSLETTFFKRGLSFDSLENTKVSATEIKEYLKLKRNFGDPNGRINEIKSILRAARFLYSTDEKLDYLTALSLAEENFKIRNQVDNVLVVKSERKMYLFKKNSIVQTFHISLGPYPVGQKEREGDGKTPEGIYILDWQRWDTPTFHSFHISYPNHLDLERAATKGLNAGSNIMVHGTSKGNKKKDWTNGCIGLTNSDMVQFGKLVFQDTQIEIRK